MIKQVFGLLAGVVISFLSTYLIFKTYTVIPGVLGAITIPLGVTWSGALIGALLSKDERISFLAGMLSATLGMPLAFVLALPWLPKPPIHFYLENLPLFVLFGFAAGSVGFIFVRLQVREGYTHAKGVGLLAGISLPLLLWTIYSAHARALYFDRGVWIFGSLHFYLLFVIPIISSVAVALISRNWKIIVTSTIVIYSLFIMPIVYFILAHGITDPSMPFIGVLMSLLTASPGVAIGIITVKLLDKLKKK